MAPLLAISIIDLYAAAFGPGFLLSAMFIAYTLIRCHFNPKLGPPVPIEERPDSMKTVLWECLVGLVPVTVLTIVTLGAILAGITTAAEAAAFGALGAIFLVVAYGRFTWKGLLDACYATLATTSMVLLLAVASNVFGAVFAWLGTATWMTNALLASPLPAWGTMSLLLGLILRLKPGQSLIDTGRRSLKGRIRVDRLTARLLARTEAAIRVSGMGRDRSCKGQNAGQQRNPDRHIFFPPVRRLTYLTQGRHHSASRPQMNATSRGLAEEPRAASRLYYSPANRSRIA
jgi:hypothetical protein